MTEKINIEQSVIAYVIDARLPLRQFKVFIIFILLQFFFLDARGDKRDKST